MKENKRQQCRGRVFTVLVITATVAYGYQPAYGQINGSVQTSDGTPVAGALVCINIQPTDPSTKPFSTVVETIEDGTFSGTGIPAGTFAVCPEAPGTDLLPLCTWQATPPLVTVVEGQTVTLPAFVLAKGVHLSVRVNDPTGNLNSMQGKVPGASLSIGVQTTSGFVIPTLVLKSDSTGQDHDVLIPPATTVQLSVSSAAFALADAQRVGLDASLGAQVPVQVASDTKPAPITFIVTGLSQTSVTPAPTPAP